MAVTSKVGSSLGNSDAGVELMFWATPHHENSRIDRADIPVRNRICASRGFASPLGRVSTCHFISPDRKGENSCDCGPCPTENFWHVPIPCLQKGGNE